MLAIILGEFAMRVVHLGVYVLPAWVSVRVAVLLERKIGSVSLRRELLLSTLIAYLIVLAALTVVPLNKAAVSGAGFISLIPGHTTLGCFRQMTGTAVEVVICNMNWLGNVLLFIPMGMLMQFVSPRFDSARGSAAAALLAAVTIEGIQYLQRSIGMGRNVDVDDIILNLGGALIGYTLMRQFRTTRAMANILPAVGSPAAGPRLKRN